MVVRCNNEYDLLEDLYIDALPDEVCQHVKNSYPCIVINFTYNKRVSMLLDKCNTVEHVVSFNKIQHNRRCDV